MRTIICSDAHGYPQLITDALAEDLADIVLVGNCDRAYTMVLEPTL